MNEPETEGRPVIEIVDAYREKLAIRAAELVDTMVSGLAEVLSSDLVSVEEITDAYRATCRGARIDDFDPVIALLMRARVAQIETEKETTSAKD